MEQDAHMTRDYMVRKCPQIYKNITIDCCDYKTTRITNKARWLILICMFVGNVLTTIFVLHSTYWTTEALFLKTAPRSKGAYFTTVLSIRHI
jgi:uncharacterized membrane protein affecting hemolysin expression